MINFKYVMAWLGLLLLTTCAPYKPGRDAPSLEFLPEQFSQTGELSLPERWWEAFDDPVLNDLMDQTLEGNLNLQAAWSRLKAAEALAVQAKALRRVSADYDGLASRASTVFQGRKRTASLYNLGLTASYEVDVWRKLSARQEAALADMRAGRADLESLALALSASVAVTYFAVAEQHQQLQLLEAQETVNRQLLEVIEARFANGVASAVDVYQQREQLAALQSQVPTTRARERVLLHQLASLLGKPPHHFDAVPGKVLPDPPPAPATGIPADLVQRRPDLMAALERVRAADQRLAAAVADRFPSLRLSAGGGWQAEQFADLLDNWIWNLAASLTGPLFDGGRRKAEVTRTEAVLQERLSAYRETVLVALSDVETALVQEQAQDELQERLQAQLALAQAAYEAGRARYLQGVGNFLIVLTELQAVQRIERSLLNARFARLSERVALYQALGGNWTQQLVSPQAAQVEVRK